MPFSRPTLSALTSQVAQDIASQIPGADPLLRFSNLGITGKVLARLANLHYGYLDWIARQAVPYTATEEFLEGWAGLVGITRKPATPASGSASFTGTAGSVIPAGTGITRGDGAAYTTQADATVGGGGTATVSILADVAGVTGNADAGTALTLASAVAGVQAVGSAATALAGGADVEADDDLRDRMLERYQEPPQGGAATDYVEWAKEVPGVSRAWCLPEGFGAGTVVVYVMLDDAEAANNGFPQGADGVAALETRGLPATGDQLTVANHIFDLQPVTALVYVVAPTAAPQAFTIHGVASEQQGAVSAAIADVFRREGSPVGGTVPLSHIEAAIIAVSGVDAFVITSPTSDIATAIGAIPIVGAITWT